MPQILIYPPTGGNEVYEVETFNIKDGVLYFRTGNEERRTTLPFTVISQAPEKTQTETRSRSVRSAGVAHRGTAWS